MHLDGLLVGKLCVLCQALNQKVSVKSTQLPHIVLALPSHSQQGSPALLPNLSSWLMPVPSHWPHGFIPVPWQLGHTCERWNPTAGLTCAGQSASSGFMERHCDWLLVGKPSQVVSEQCTVAVFQSCLVDSPTEAFWASLAHQKSLVQPPCAHCHCCVAPAAGRQAGAEAVVNQHMSRRSQAALCNRTCLQP